MSTLRFFAISLILTAVATACAPRPTLTPITVQLRWTHQAQFAGFYVADQNGYYKEEGLAVTFLPGGPTVDMLKPVLDGTAQFGVVGADAVIEARSQGQPLRAIKEKGGSVFVQSPETAKFDGMPHSAIDAGLADVITPVQELPACISTFIHHAPLFSKSGLADQDIARRALVGGMCKREQMK